MRKPIKTKLSALILGAALLLPAVANADVYMHNPRGSNNRMNESSSSTSSSSSADQSALDSFVDWVSSFF